MWKQYLQPTKSTKAKSRESQNVGERLQNLSSALSGLKEEIKIENSATAQNLERLEKQQLATLHSQVFTLKKALSDLADAMIDEVEGVRKDYRAEIDELKDQVFERIDSFSQNIQISSENSNKISSSLTLSIKQAFQHIQSLKTSQEDLQRDFRSLSQSFQLLADSQKEVNLNLDKSFKENCEQVLKISQNFKDFSLKIREIEIMPKQLNYVIEKEKEKNKTVEEKVFRELKEFDCNLKKFEKELENIGSRREMLDLKDFVLTSEFKFSENLNQFKKEIIDLSLASEKKWEEFNRVQENFNSVVCNEIKAIDNFNGFGKRIEFLEELCTTQRRELFNTLTSLEQNIYKKQEKIIKAVYQLARGQNMPEAMLMI
jgi:DNA repair exonuclease SbcCD ATPase subunit